MIEQDDNSPEGVPSQMREKKRSRKAKVINDDKDHVGARKPGRPKQALQIPNGCQSILNFF